MFKALCITVPSSFAVKRPANANSKRTNEIKSNRLSPKKLHLLVARATNLNTDSNDNDANNARKGTNNENTKGTEEQGEIGKKKKITNSSSNTSKRVARRRVSNPTTQQAMTKAKASKNDLSAALLSSSDTSQDVDDNKEDEQAVEEEAQEEEEEEENNQTIVVRTQNADLELELGTADNGDSVHSKSVKVKTKVVKARNPTSTAKRGSSKTATTDSAKSSSSRKTVLVDEYDVKDWKKWNERFDQLAKEDDALVALNGQLQEAIDCEDYDRASTVRDAIEASLNVDPAMKIRRGFVKALEQEDYGAAAKFRDSGAGLLGWWHGVDITDYLNNNNNNSINKTNDETEIPYAINGDQWVYKKNVNSADDGSFLENDEDDVKKSKNIDVREQSLDKSQTTTTQKKFTKGTIVHVTVKRGRLVGTSFTARELADANDESPLNTVEIVKAAKRSFEESFVSSSSDGDDDDDDDDDEEIIGYEVKDQTFGFPYFEMHVREKYDAATDEMKFVTQSARVHYVEAFRKIPVVDLKDDEDGDDNDKIVITREKNDDDTDGSDAREERIRKLKAELLLNVNLLRAEINESIAYNRDNNKMSGATPSASDNNNNNNNNKESSDKKKKDREDRFKLVQEIRNEIMRGGDRLWLESGKEMFEKHKKQLDNVIDTIFDVFDEKKETDEPPSREEMIQMLEDYDGLDEYGNGLLNALREFDDDNDHHAQRNEDIIINDSYEDEILSRFGGRRSTHFFTHMMDDGEYDDEDNDDDDNDDDDLVDYDDDDFDESNIVESEGGFDSRMRSIEDLYADPSLYDRVRVPAVCDRLTQSSFLLKSGPMSSESKNSESKIESSTVRFERIPEHVATQSTKDPFDRLYVGAFGPHGAEIVRIVRGRYGDELGEDANCITGIKLTGDANVPAGAASFRAKIDDSSKLPKLTGNGLQTYPEELGVLARYKGQGRVAKPGFKDPSWTDGELLLLDGKGGQLTGGAELGFVWAVPNERRLLILFTSLKLPSDLSSSSSSSLSDFDSIS